MSKSSNHLVNACEQNSNTQVLPNYIRGKNLKDKNRHRNGRRTRWCSVSSKLTFTDCVILKIDETFKSFVIEKAILNTPKELYNHLTCKSNKDFCNDVVYRKLMEELKLNHSDFYEKIEKIKKQNQAIKNIKKKLRENPDLKPYSKDRPYQIDALTGSGVVRL